MDCAAYRIKDAADTVPVSGLSDCSEPPNQQPGPDIPQRALSDFLKDHLIERYIHD